MSFRQGHFRPQRGSSSRLRKRRDRAFFEALESCASNERLQVRPLFTFSPPVVAVRFGHLYKEGADRQMIESLVWRAVMSKYPHQLVAMDPQRLGSPTAAYDLHFREQFLTQKHDLQSLGRLSLDILGKQEQLPVSTKGSQVSPCLAEVVVKRLDGRWARKGATAALLQAAGYKAGIAVHTEFSGDLPRHLACWSEEVGRSDVIVAKVAAPASDPSLRKLPRSIQFQGLRVSISVSRSLQNKHEQRKVTAAEDLAKQAHRKAKRVKRQAKKRQKEQQQQPPSEEVGAQVESVLVGELPTVAEDMAVLEANAGDDPALVSHSVEAGEPLAVSSHDDLPGTSAPLTGKRRDPESGSDSSDVASVSASLAIVPATPEEDCAHGLRRSSREHKKPRPYYAETPPQPPDKPTVGKGLQRGFFK